MKRFTRIAFFISGHGYGHGVRETALIDALPAEAEVFIFSSLPEAFFREELHRPWRLFPCELDCGTLQKDIVDVDVEKTLAAYLAIESRRDEFVAALAPKLKDLGVDLLIGDVPPLAFPVAKAAGVPGWAVYNFTWLDIYRPLVERHPRYRPMLARMEDDYRLADRHIRMFPAMEAEPLGPREEVGLVCKPGQPRREEFARRFGLDPGKKWCTVYLGDAGLGGVAWENFARFPDWEFIGLYELPGVPANYKYVRKDRSFRYFDLTASCDLVLGKLGYSLICGCLSLGKPVLYLGRNDFAEHALLAHVVDSRGLGREVSLEAFRRLDIGREMQALTEGKIAPMPVTGVDEILAKIGYSAPG